MIIWTNTNLLLAVETRLVVVLLLLVEIKILDEHQHQLHLAELHLPAESETVEEVVVAETVVDVTVGVHLDVEDVDMLVIWCPTHVNRNLLSHEDYQPSGKTYLIPTL